MLAKEFAGGMSSSTLIVKIVSVENVKTDIMEGGNQDFYAMVLTENEDVTCTFPDGRICKGTGCFLSRARKGIAYRVTRSHAHAHAAYTVPQTMYSTHNISVGLVEDYVAVCVCVLWQCGTIEERYRGRTISDTKTYALGFIQGRMTGVYEGTYIDPPKKLYERADLKEDVHFDVLPGETSFQIAVWDQDPMGADDFIGYTTQVRELVFR